MRFVSYALIALVYGIVALLVYARGNWWIVMLCVSSLAFSCYVVGRTDELRRR